VTALGEQGHASGERVHRRTRFFLLFVQPKRGCPVLRIAPFDGCLSTRSTEAAPGHIKYHLLQNILRSHL
jgi:hypothetical protein